MAVLDDFAAHLQSRGISLDPAALPDEGTVVNALERMSNWFWYDLGAAVREGYDEATGTEGLCYMLAEDEFSSIGGDVRPLLEAWDQTSGGMTFSICLDESRQCLQLAIEGSV